MTGVQTCALPISNGTINDTGRELDMAINGEGFFIMEDNSGKYDNVYTRNGSFKLDKEGFITAQEGNRLQGYLLNEELSTENNPKFDTTLSSINLDALNKEPKATDEMDFDINLDGQEGANFNPDGNDINEVIDDVTQNITNDLVSFYKSSAGGGMGDTSAQNLANSKIDNLNVASAIVAINGGAGAGSAQGALSSVGAQLTNVIAGLSSSPTLQGRASAYANNITSGYESMLTTVDNLMKLTNPEQKGEYGGFPDFSTNKTVHDSLGGEHRLTTNFYKRDVVTTDAPGGNGLGEKYTSWIVEYTMEDYNEETGEWETSGHVTDSDPKEAGQIYEMRYDVNGNLIDMRQPTIDGDNYKAEGANIINVIPPGGELPSYNDTDEVGWESIGRTATVDFTIDDPITGANDPLGGEDAEQNITLEADFSEMTQFAGSYNLRGVSQNGYAIGDLVGVTTGLDGVIEARYSNGRSVPVAQLGLADFNDKNALEKLGGQTYAETFASGEVEIGRPQDNGMGTVNAGSLEYSNVDTAGELVNMIQTQRTYQASAQVVQTSQTLMQTILQL